MDLAPALPDILTPLPRYRQSDASSERDEARLPELLWQVELAPLHESGALERLVELHREQDRFPLLRRHALRHEPFDDEQIAPGPEHPRAIGEGLGLVGEMEHLAEVDDVGARG